MQILKETGIDWRNRKLINEKYMEQKVKIRLGTEVWRLGEASGKDDLSPIVFNLCSEYITKDAPECLETSKEDKK
jgi:hypothetical protein